MTAEKSDFGIKVEEFLGRYAALSEGEDFDAMAECFAPVFLAGGAEGVQAVRREDFARMLPRRKQMFAGAGLRRSALAAVEVKGLCEGAATADTVWRMEFVQPEGGTVALDVRSIFLVSVRADRCEIALYLSCQDAMAMLEERRLLGQKPCLL